MRAALWGTDHEELGEIASATAGERAAVAITRGRFPKAYRYLDPNEDAVAVVAGARASLLVCADGHNGATSSEVAVAEVLAAIGDDPPPDFSDRDWLDLFEAVNSAVIERKGADSPQPSSNTVLLVAIEAGGRLTFASLGDAALVVARPGDTRGRQLNREAMRFAGYPMNRRSLKGTVHRGEAALRPGEWVVAVTDGLSEFIAPLRPSDVLPNVVAAGVAGGPEGVARRVVETACNAGAGDNVAVAVLAPGA